MSDCPDVALRVDEEIVMHGAAPGPENPGGGIEANQPDLVEHRDDAAVGQELCVPQEPFVAALSLTDSDSRNGFLSIGGPGLHDPAVHVHERRDGRAGRREEIQTIL